MGFMYFSGSGAGKDAKLAAKCFTAATAEAGKYVHQARVENSSEMGKIVTPQVSKVTDFCIDSAEKVYRLRYGSGDLELFRSYLVEGPKFPPCREAREAGFGNAACFHFRS